MSLLVWILLASLLSLVFLIVFKGLGSSQSSGEQPDNTKELKALETKIDESQKSIKKILDDNFEYSKNEVKESEKKKVKAEEKLKENEKRLEELNVINKQQGSEVTNFKDELAEKHKESKKYEEELIKKSLLIKEINEELKELKSFENSIKSPKLMKLLSTLLSNSALSQYREKSEIVDDSAESIYNLLLKLSTGQIFVKSYYETLVEYKKEHQKEMSSEEVAFYEAINSFFGEEVIKNPNRSKVEGKFDKSKHRGIHNEKEGTIDNSIVLIPSDTTNNDKIKVKLKV